MCHAKEQANTMFTPNDLQTANMPPITVEVTTVATGEKKEITLNKEDFPNIKRWGRDSDRKVIESLSAAFAPPNFSWKIIGR